MRKKKMKKMTEAQFKARVADVTREELKQPVRWHYLSFSGDDKFLGAVVIQGQGVLDCVSKTRRLDINPGGQVLCGPLPADELPPEADRNRLLSAEDVRRIWPDAKTIAEHEKEGT